MTQPNRKWHESLAGVLVVIVCGAIVTSPCWGFALLLWVTR